MSAESGLFLRRVQDLTLQIDSATRARKTAQEAAREASEA